MRRLHIPRWAGVALAAFFVAPLLELAWRWLARKNRWAAMGKPSLAYEWPDDSSMTFPPDYWRGCDV